MKIFVTGGTSFVGRHVVKALLDAGVDSISILTRRKLADTPRISYLEGDVRDGSLLRRVLRGHDSVLHLAGCKHRPEFLHQVNIQGTRNVIEACRSSPEFKLLIHLSGVYVYGTSSDAMIDEQTTCRPIRPFDRSRYESDLIVHGFAEERPNQAVILRTGNIFGEHDPEQHLLNLIRKIRAGRFYFVGRDVARFQVNYIYVKEVAGLLAQLAGKQAPSPLYIVNTPARLEEFVAILKLLTNQEAAIRHLPYGPVNLAAKLFDLVPKSVLPHPPVNSLKLSEVTNRTIYSPVRLMKELHWQPIHSLQTALGNLHHHYGQQQLL